MTVGRLFIMLALASVALIAVLLVFNEQEPEFEAEDRHTSDLQRKAFHAEEARKQAEWEAQARRDYERRRDSAAAE